MGLASGARRWIVDRSPVPLRPSATTAMRVALVIAAIVLIPVSGRAQATLEIPPDIRSEAMGGAEVVLAPGPYAAWGNVGALGFFAGSGIAGTRYQLVPDYAEDIYYRFGSAAVAIPLGGNRLVFDVNTAHVGYMDFNTQPYGPPNWNRHDDAAGIAAAFGIGKRIGVGVGVQTVSSGTDRSDFAQGGRTTALDFGILYAVPWFASGANRSGRSSHWDDPRVGLSASHLGAPLHGVDQRATSLPHIVRIAIGESVHLGPDSGTPPGAGATASPALRVHDRVTITASVAAEKLLLRTWGSSDSAGAMSYLDRHRIILRGGAEARFLGLLALRAGYLYNDSGEIKGATFGGGLSWHDWAGFDCASVPQYHELSRLKQFSAWLRVPWPAGP